MKIAIRIVISLSAGMMCATVLWLAIAVPSRASVTARNATDRVGRSAVANCRPRNVPIANLAPAQRQLPVCPSFKRPNTPPPSKKLLRTATTLELGGPFEGAFPTLCSQNSVLLSSPIDYWISDFFAGDYVLNHPDPTYADVERRASLSYCSTSPDDNIIYSWKTPTGTVPIKSETSVIENTILVGMPRPQTTGLHTLTILTRGKKLTKTIVAREYDGQRIRAYSQDGMDITDLSSGSTLDRGRARLMPGSSLTIAYHGFTPNDTIEVGLYKWNESVVQNELGQAPLELVDIWEVQVDDSGAFTETLLIPTDSESGFFRLEACGTTGCDRATLGPDVVLTKARTSFEVVTYPIAFVVGPSGQGDINLIEPNGANKRRLANPNRTDESEPDWSPDGAQIAYQSNAEVFRIIFDAGESIEPFPDKTGDYNIWIIGHSGKPELVVDADVDVREPDWSPNGANLVYRAGGEANRDGVLMIYDFGTRQSKSLGRTEIKGRSPVWSPDGQMIAFMSERTGRWQLYVYDTQTGRERQLTRCPNHCRFPNWSPDGGSILFHSADSNFTPLGAYRAWLDRPRPEPLLKDGQPGRPAEAETGWIVYNGPNDLYVFDPASREQAKIPNSFDATAPDWSPSISTPLEIGTPVR